MLPGTMIGQSIAHYTITEKIGQGGMGEVYRATDTKLNRDVALKVLPEAFAQDQQRMARFSREAQVLASLNHPNIASIYGLEEADGKQALVLELVEGEDLAERIKRGAIPLEESLKIALQIAQALEAAHEKGIIHRDLKPANVKITPEGVVKVLDFGLAKALEEEPPAAEVHDSPTISQLATKAGIILGTAAYMSPEQARGKEVDRRTDIWAFGAVLHEMLTGKTAFQQEDISLTLASVMRDDPKWEDLPKSVPTPIRQLLNRSLTKDIRRRLQAIGEARVVIEDCLTDPAAQKVDVVVTSQPSNKRQMVPWLLATTVVGAIIAGFLAWNLKPQGPRPTPRLVQFVISPPTDAPLGLTNNYPDIAISPDGSRIVYFARSRRLHVRSFAQVETTLLINVEGLNAFFSPAGDRVGFFAPDNTLKKMSILGGPATTICELDDSLRGASWGTEETIVFATNTSNGLLSVPAAGGEPRQLTTVDQEGERHLWPEVLPGGPGVLFTITEGSNESMQIAVLSLETGEQKVLVPGSNPHYSPTGHLVYALEGALFAVAFDLDRLEVSGEPVPVLEDVMTKPNGAASFSLSGDGSLIYVPGNVAGIERTLVWVDREGREEPLPARPRAYSVPRVSPDGTKVAFAELSNSVWIYDLRRNVPTQLTFTSSLNGSPLWTPDGRRLVFRSNRVGRGSSNLYWRAADGTGQAERLTTNRNFQIAYSFSPDGKKLVFIQQNPKTRMDIHLLSLEGGRTSKPLLQTEFTETTPVISPDGRWLAYGSDEQGQFQVYVRPFPNVQDGKWPISPDGGRHPVWAPDGDELFYRDGQSMMAVSVEADDVVFRAGIPRVLFRGEYLSRAPREYDIHPDGRQFLMIKEGGTTDEVSTPTQIMVVLNWFQELKRLVPTEN